ncbi:MAG: ThiF family adenylyltransferase [Flavobacteriales bacterium]
MLNEKEIQRYDRQMILRGFGKEKQEKLKAASVLVIGAGGLGCPALQYLAAAGIGRLGIVDGDKVEISNLHRQILFNNADIGQNKAAKAAEKINALNAFVKTDIYSEHLSTENALEIISGYDIIIDGTDNFPARYLINDACVILGKPNVFASISEFSTQVSIFNYSTGAQRGVNYRDLYPVPPAPGEVPSCADAGVIGALPGIAGTAQAMEVIKLITGIGTPLVDKLWIYDTLSNSSHTIGLSIDETQFPICELINYEIFCGHSENIKEIDPSELKKHFEDYTLIDVRTADKHNSKNIGGENIFIDDLEKKLKDLDKTKTYALYCSTGNKSKRAAEILQKNGFDKVVTLKGGLSNYE